MLKLFVPKVPVLSEFDGSSRRILKVTTKLNHHPRLRHTKALLVRGTPDILPADEINSGYGAYLLEKPGAIPNSNTLLLVDDLAYLKDGDVIRVDPKKATVKSLWRRDANSNSFLLTERCNSFCIMCSQPPRDVEDGYLLDELLETIPLIDSNASDLGITGGEPTLYGPRFVHLLWVLKSALPDTTIQVLSNGRNFSDLTFAAEVGRVNHPDLIFGIPLYSDNSSRHDFIVQADGAFDQTIFGILNLKRCGVRVEIRVVCHRQSVDRLPQLASFIARNLTFVDHVALMGLELTGFTLANREALVIDPVEYQESLASAVQILDDSGIKTSIYNHPLCLLPSQIWRFAVKSISDWKNEYLDECKDCDVRARCGGFFATSRAMPTKNVHAIRLPR